MTQNDLIDKVSARAKILADWPISRLRLLACQSMSGSQYAADQELQGKTRGALVEMILTDEFIEQSIRYITD